MGVRVARRKFPSDELRRKTRPHVKVHLTCRSHPRYGDVFEKPEDRGIAWGLWFLGVQYFAPNDDDQVTLGRGDLTWLTGRSQWASALNALRTLCERLEYPVSVHGQRVTVTIRNLQRKQGLDSALRIGATRTPHSPEPEEYDYEYAERVGAAKPPHTPDSLGGETPPKRKRESKAPTLCSEDLTPEQWTQIRSWRDRKHPEFDDQVLEREWEMHSAHWRSEKKRRANWVASFQKWLLKSRGMQNTAPQAARPTPPVVVPSGESPPTMTEAEKAKAHEQYLEDKAVAGFRPGGRRPRTKKKP
jgi:hypothetical protein